MKYYHIQTQERTQSIRTRMVQTTYWKKYHHDKYIKNTVRRNHDAKPFTAEAKDCEQCKRVCKMKCY